VLTAWRGVDVTPEEISARPSGRPVSEAVGRLVTNLRLDRRRAEAEIVRVWNSIIDPEIAAHAQPAGIARGTLFVNVDNSVWLSEIVRYRRREILGRLQSSFGTEMIARISFRLG
jgi:predicted nucleic acid-binding Zn ribbon protein